MLGSLAKRSCFSATCTFLHLLQWYPSDSGSSSEAVNARRQSCKYECPIQGHVSTVCWYIEHSIVNVPPPLSHHVSLQLKQLSRCSGKPH